MFVIAEKIPSGRYPVDAKLFDFIKLLNTFVVVVTQNFINTMLSATAALIVQAAVTPYFLIVVLPFVVIYYYIQRFIRYAFEFLFTV